MNIDELAWREGAGAEIYRLLSECYHRPSRDLAGVLMRLRQCLETVFPSAVEHVEAMKEDFNRGDDLDRLLVDYAGLFVGPFELLAPPYGSVYLEGKRQVLGESTLDAVAMYRQSGVDLSAGFLDAPDHIAAELEFMYYLVFKTTEMISRNDPEGAAEYAKAQSGFLTGHLGSWAPAFTGLVEENARTIFYRRLAGLTRAFIDRDVKGICRFWLRTWPRLSAAAPSLTVRDKREDKKEGVGMKRFLLAGLVALLAVALAAPAAFAYQVKIGMRLKTDVFYMVMNAGSYGAADIRQPDVTGFQIGIQDDSYLRLDFLSDDKRTGARIELGMWALSGVAGNVGIGVRHLYGWYKFGRCKLVIGHTDNMFAWGGGAPYAQLGWADRGNLITRRIRNKFKNTGKLTSGRFAQIALYYTVGAWTFMGSLGMPPNDNTTNGPTPGGNAAVVQQYMIYPRLDVAVMFRGKYFTIVPGFSIYRVEWETWEGAPNLRDDSVLAWAIVLPFHVNLGAFGFKGEVSVNQNWTTSNYDHYWHQAAWWGGANDAGRVKLKDTRTYAGALGFYYKIGRATIWLSGGWIMASNGTSDMAGGWRHGQNVRYGFSFAVPYKVNRHFTIAPELSFYNFGWNPFQDVGGSANPAAPTSTTADLGSVWLLGIQFLFKF